MSRRVDVLPKARADLLDIWLYIADDNPGAADKVLARIDDLLAMIADAPEAGRARPELAEGLRSFPSGNYVLFYLPSADAITLVRVLERHRDIEAIFGEEGGLS